MGQTSGALNRDSATSQKRVMEIQRSYVNVNTENVDFSDPTNADEESDGEEEGKALESKEEDEPEQATEEEVSYSAYKPSKLQITGMRPHPSNAVENGTLATVMPPNVTYDLQIAKSRRKVVTERRLSDLQLEFVAYACQKHEQNMPSGARCGFFLGDGAGMGKGRQLAGMIMENMLQGRKKHIWVSTNIDLKVDAERDLSDLGITSEEMEVLTLPATYKAIPQTEGVLFCTYSGLSTGCSEKAVDQGKRRRLDQVLEWCGEDFDGCLLFDEAHRAKNLVAEVSGLTTAAGQAVFEIQRELPRARVVYCSATAVSEPRNYAYMTRLGLWGPGSPFPNTEGREDQDEGEDGGAVNGGGENSLQAVQNFIKVTKQRGMGAMEICALHLKQEGALLCRTLSFQGAEFEICEATLTSEQQRQYDKAARLWQYLHTRLESKLAQSALDIENEDNEERKYLMNQKYKLERASFHSQLWGGHQRFFRSLITSFKVPTLVGLAKDALANDCCVVIGLQSTGEAHDKRAQEALKKKKNEEDDEDAENATSMLSAPQETLKYVLKKIWAEEIAMEEEVEDVLRQKAAAEAASAANDDDEPLIIMGSTPAKKQVFESDDDSLFADSPSFECAEMKKKKKRKDMGSPFKKKKKSTSSSFKKRRESPMGSEIESQEDLAHDPWGWDVSPARGNYKPSPKKGKKKLSMDDDYDEDEEDSDDDSDDEVIDLAEEEDDEEEDRMRNAEGEEWIKMFIKQVDDLDLPGNALDVIIDELGNFDAVAEMSGRSSRMIRNYKGEFEYQKRTLNGVSGDEQNIYEREEFQAGRKLVAIISDAASSGISLHSENTARVKNQKRRVHITLELPWSADKTIQQMGRSHRSNQSSAPHYKLLVSPLGGERRFCAAVVKRLESLGALTQGDRRATGGMSSSMACFNVDTKEGAASVLDMYHHASWETWKLLGDRGENPENPLVKPPKLPRGEELAIAKLCVENPSVVGASASWCGAGVDKEAGVKRVAEELNVLHAATLWLSLVGINVDETEDKVNSEDSGNNTVVVAKFLNRILGLEVSRQQYLFDYFARYLEMTIKAAIRDGSYNRGITNLNGRTVEFQEGRTAIKLPTPSVVPLQLMAVSIDRGMDYAAAVAKRNEARGGVLQAPAPAPPQNTNNFPLRPVHRFGERDAFRLTYDSKFICLIVEIGEASLRGLSVKTDKFRVYYPDRDFRVTEWKGVNSTGFMKNSESEDEAKAIWTRCFNNRKKLHVERLITGPILYIWSMVLNAQHLLHPPWNAQIRIVRAVEKDSKGKASGRVELGIKLDEFQWQNVLKKLEQMAKDSGDSDKARYEMLKGENQRQGDYVKAKHAKSAKDAAATRRKRGGIPE